MSSIRRSNLTSITSGLLTVIGDSFQWLNGHPYIARGPLGTTRRLRQLQELANDKPPLTLRPRYVTAVTSYVSKYPSFFGQPVKCEVAHTF
jgi:hypothetical protein